MPGRHSGGSGLGGGFGGMRGGGLGGGYRGGGPGWGGGWRGPGWGWGGWGWRGPGPFGWGWIMPWTWFGPVGGYGAGCGGVGCVILLLLAAGAVFVVWSPSRGGSVSNGYRGGFSNSAVSDSGSANGGASLANESPAIQTQTAHDLTELHTAFDSRIATWQTQVGNNQNLSIPPADAGLTADNNTQAVFYGKCGSALYIYVVDKTKPDTGPANGEGYVYTTASSPGACHPPQWAVYDSEDVGGGWYFATLASVS